MHIGDLQAALRALAEARPEDVRLRRAVNHLVTQIDGHETMAVEDFVRLFKQRKAAPAAAVPAATGSVASRLKLVFDNDDAFESELARIERDKAVTKATLASAFCELFDRASGVPKKATRAEILRLIADERHIVVRNEKMGKLLGRRIIAAE